MKMYFFIVINIYIHVINTSYFIDFGEVGTILASLALANTFDLLPGYILQKFIH